MSRTATVRTAAGLVGVLLAVGGLTGCGRDQPASSAGPAAATATTTAPSTTPRAGRARAQRAPSAAR